LNYAVKNRQEWELKGREIVADLITQAATTIRVNTKLERQVARRQIVSRLLSNRAIEDSVVVDAAAAESFQSPEENIPPPLQT
jgi:hypothetical protein